MRAERIGGTTLGMLTHGALAHMAANGGLLLWAQARDSGITTPGIRHLLRSGRLVTLRRGVYFDGDLWVTLDLRAQQRLRTRAALLTMQRGGVVSHDSAAFEHGMDILLPPVPHVHITRRGSTTAWSRSNVKHHYAGFSPRQVVTIDGLEVLDMARTAVDIARENGAPYGEIACDSAIRLGVTRMQLEEAYEPMVSWPYRGRMVQAVQFARPGAESVAETLGRLLVHELGLGRPDLQFPVVLRDGRVAWCDLRIGRHVFEVDGLVKLVPVGEGGVAQEPAHQVVWKQQKRGRLLRDEGLGTSRIIWQDFWPPHRATALRRLREEYDDTVRRLGAVLPERLARQAAELRSRPGARGA